MGAKIMGSAFSSDHADEITLSKAKASGMGHRLRCRFAVFLLVLVSGNQLAHIRGHAGTAQIGLQANKFVFFLGHGDVNSQALHKSTIQDCKTHRQAKGQILSFGLLGGCFQEAPPAFGGGLKARKPAGSYGGRPALGSGEGKKPMRCLCCALDAQYASSAKYALHLWVARLAHRKAGQCQSCEGLLARQRCKPGCS